MSCHVMGRGSTWDPVSFCYFSLKRVPGRRSVPQGLGCGLAQRSWCSSRWGHWQATLNVSGDGVDLLEQMMTWADQLRLF